MFGILSRNRRYPLLKDKVYVGAGINLLTREIGRIYWEKPHYQAIVFGGSGSGKSELISRWTYEAILDDKQFFGIDPKGSKSWLESFFLACYRKGILYDKEKGPIILALPYPEVSVKINPIYGMTPHQIASTIASGIPEGREPFFKQIAYEIVLTASLGLYAKGVEEIILSDIYEYLNVGNLQKLEEKVANEIVSSPEKKELIQEALMTLKNIAQYDPQYFPRVNSSLRTYLTRLITGNAGAILNVRAGNILWDRLEKGNLKFFAFLNAEAEMQIAYDVGRLLFANLLVYVGMQSKQLKKVKPQLRVIVDEATEVGFAELNKAIRLVRERNVSVSIFTQSPYGFASAFGNQGKNMVIDIVNSCDLRIAFRLASDEDRRFIANMSPEVSKGQLMLHQNSMNLYYKEAKLLKPFDFEKLEPGFGYAFLDQTVYYFYTPLVSKYDKTKVEVIFTEQAQEVKSDVVVNMKDVSEAYLGGVESKEVKAQDTQVFEQNTNTNDVLIVVMKEIFKNYSNKISHKFENIEIQRFYEQIKDFFNYYREDLEKILSLFDVFKHQVKSVVGNDKNILTKVSLLDHSLNVAINSYEEVKDLNELSQEEKEIIVLASLSHDIGKAFVNKKTYEGKDHERMTQEVLEKIKVNPIIIKIATAHHEKPEKLGHLAKLVKFVKTADHQAREEETKHIKSTISKEYKQQIDRFIQNIQQMVDKTREVLSNKEGTGIYVRKEYVYNTLKKLIKDVKLDDDFILTLFPERANWVRLKAYSKTGKILINSIYLFIELENQIKPTQISKDVKEINNIKTEILT